MLVATLLPLGVKPESGTDSEDESRSVRPLNQRVAAFPVRYCSKNESATGVAREEYKSSWGQREGML